MPYFRLFRLIGKNNNKNAKVNFGIENVTQKDYAITKMRSFAAFSFIASQKQYLVAPHIKTSLVITLLGLKLRFKRHCCGCHVDQR